MSESRSRLQGEEEEGRAVGRLSGLGSAVEGQKVALRVSCEQSRCSTVQRRRGGGGRTERSARSPRRSCSLSASNCPPCSARLLPVLRARLFSPVPSPSTPAFLPPSEPRSCGTKLTARPSPRPPPRRASISHLARLQGPPRVVVDPGPGPEGVGPHRRPPRQLAHLQDRHRHPHRRDLGRRHLERALCPQRGGRHPRLVRHLPRLRLEPRPRALPRVGRRPDPGPSLPPSLPLACARDQSADCLSVSPSTTSRRSRTSSTRRARLTPRLSAPASSRSRSSRRLSSSPSSCSSSPRCASSPFVSKVRGALSRRATPG